MTRRPRVAVVVPGLDQSGGVVTAARFVIEAAERADRFDLTLVSLAVSSRDELSFRMLSPSSWARSVTKAPAIWEGREVTRVGAPLAEVEVCRYLHRRALSQCLRDADVIQVVAGAPSWAFPVTGLGKPVSLHVATRVREERQMRDGAALSVQTLWRRSMTAAVSRLEGKTLRSVDAVQAMNSWLVEDARSVNAGRPDVDIRLAPPGIDAELFCPAPAGRSARRYILSVGRFDDPRKNVGLLLRAFGSIAADFPDVDLVTAGASRPPEAYFAAAREMGLVGRVTHVDRPPLEELIGLYQDAEIFALASDEEGFGIVLMEAMSCGVPVVSTRSGGPEGLISDGHDGLLVPRGDADGLAAGLASLLADRDRARAMGESARTTVEQRYAADVAGRQFLEVWDSLLERTS
jgi:glycosyltransferase involved in cell wall biosynthesis